MKRLHVHVTVSDLDESIGFYSTLFGDDPTVRKDDYAKWMLDDPCVNFAISVKESRTPGINHLGIQVDNAEDLSDITERLAAANRPIVEQSQAECCYAVGDKTWATDPEGVAWETFHTEGEITTYGKDTGVVADLAARDEACGGGAKSSA